MLEIHWAKTLNSGNLRINFIHHHLQGIVTHLRSHHFQALRSSTTSLRSPWHEPHNQALVRPKDIRLMGHHGMNMISPKEDMVYLKCSPLSNSQDIGHHLQAHLECLQHCLETIQSFGQPLPLPPLQDNFLAPLLDPPLGSQQDYFSRLRNSGGQMLPKLPISPHYLRFCMTNMMQIMGATIHQTWAGPKAKPQSAWNKWNSLWSNLPKGWGSPMLVRSTSGRKYGWLGFWRRSIGLLSGDRTISNHSKMDPCTGIRRWQIFWRLARPGCLWKLSTMPNGFSNGGLWCVWRNVQARFGRCGRREGKATSNRRQILLSARGTIREVPPRVAQYNSHSCDSSSVEWQQWPDIQQSTPIFVHRCEELGGADWFHRTKL